MQPKKPINIRIGGNIQRLREEHHYTQEELSEKIGVTPNHLSAIERGVSGISLELLERVCQALEVTSDHILFGHSEPEHSEQEFIGLIEGISQTQLQIVKMMQTMAETMEKLKR